jgi:NAD(P)-dependent dehydrogenase (short-subunit alcohol dehydrogenase family)
MMSHSTVYLITGSTGIAAATAKMAVQAGISVFFTSRTAENCQRLFEEVRAAGGECDFLPAELTDPAAVEAVVQACVARYGRIDALFNVAGISGRRFGDGPIHECSVEGWEITMDTNVKSQFLMCRAVLNQMLAQPIGENGLRGSMLNMASVLGFSPEAKHFATHAYAASKGAIIGLSKSMAAYYAPHKIRVNVIAPALIRTPMSARAQQNPVILDYMKIKQPLAEDLIDAEEVAKAALFLLGDQARQITGDVLTVDAGWSVSG